MTQKQLFTEPPVVPWTCPLCGHEKDPTQVYAMAWQGIVCHSCGNDVRPVIDGEECHCEAFQDDSMLVVEDVIERLEHALDSLWAITKRLYATNDESGLAILRRTPTRT